MKWETQAAMDCAVVHIGEKQSNETEGARINPSQADTGSTARLRYSSGLRYV
jgi:hypothetical protein